MQVPTCPAHQPGRSASGPLRRIPGLCHCGCRRSLEGRRADCRFYNGTCRKQYLRDRAKALQDVPRRCRCGPGALHTLDPADGDVSCQKCGRVVGRLTALVSYYPMKALMTGDVDGRRRRPARKRPERQRDWRDFQPFPSPHDREDRVMTATGDYRSYLPPQLAEELRRARVELGLSGREAAMRAGICPAYLSHLERGDAVPVDGGRRVPDQGAELAWRHRCPAAEGGQAGRRTAFPLCERTQRRRAVLRPEIPVPAGRSGRRRDGCWPSREGAAAHEPPELGSRTGPDINHQRSDRWNTRFSAWPSMRPRRRSSGSSTRPRQRASGFCRSRRRRATSTCSWRDGGADLMRRPTPPANRRQRRARSELVSHHTPARPAAVEALEALMWLDELESEKRKQEARTIARLLREQKGSE